MSATTTERKREKRPAAAPSYLPDIHRLLPQSPDAEQGVLASFLLQPREVGGLCAEKGIVAEHFHIPAHATIYGVLAEMWDKNRPIDIITLTQELRDRDLLKSVGGPALVSSLFTFLPTAANAGYYGETLEEKATLRQIIKVGTEFAARSYEEQDAARELLAEFEQAAFAIGQARLRTAAVSMKAAVIAATNSIQELYDRRGGVTGLTTGFDELDKMTDGLHGAEMIVIAARPSMGKTALVMNIAEHISTHPKEPRAVAIFSLEMSLQQLVQRMLCSRARVNLSRVRDGFLAEKDFAGLHRMAAQLAEAKMFIDDASGLSILELRAKARRLKSQHDIAAVVVDYLQLLRSGSKRAQENRQIEISEISNGLKGLAKELNVPVLVAAQLNRKTEDRAGGRPRLSDLRESGSIEQDADLVGLLVREEYYAESDEEKKDSEGKATLIIAKQRNGPVGDVDLTFLKEFTRFETRAKSEEEG